MSDFSSLSDIEKAPRIWRIRDRNNPFEIYDNVKFKMIFEFRKAVVMQLLQEFLNLLLPEINPLMLYDNFSLLWDSTLPTGYFQSCIGNTIIHQSSVSRIVHRVPHYIARKANYEPIKMLTEKHIPRICQAFHQIARMPRIIEATDCSYIKMSSPGGELTVNLHNHAHNSTSNTVVEWCFVYRRDNFHVFRLDWEISQTEGFLLLLLLVQYYYTHIIVSFKITLVIITFFR